MLQARPRPLLKRTVVAKFCNTWRPCQLPPAALPGVYVLVTPACVPSTRCQPEHGVWHPCHLVHSHGPWCRPVSVRLMSGGSRRSGSVWSGSGRRQRSAHGRRRSRLGGTARPCEWQRTGACSLQCMARSGLLKGDNVQAARLIFYAPPCFAPLRCSERALEEQRKKGDARRSSRSRSRSGSRERRRRRSGSRERRHRRRSRSRDRREKKQRRHSSRSRSRGRRNDSRERRRRRSRSAERAAKRQGGEFEDEGQGKQLEQRGQSPASAGRQQSPAGRASDRKEGGRKGARTSRSASPSRSSGSGGDSEGDKAWVEAEARRKALASMGK